MHRKLQFKIIESMKAIYGLHIKVNKDFTMAKTVGRPREFSTEDVLDKAIVYFRRFGYNRTSISRLEAYTGITAGSIYKAFKSKDNFYKLAFDRYVRDRHDSLKNRLAACNNAKEQLYEFLRHYAEVSYGQQGNDGCMVVMSAVELSSGSDKIKNNIKRIFSSLQVQLEQILEEGHKDGTIKIVQSDIETQAKFIVTLLQGMRVVGKVDRTKSEVDNIIRLVMTFFKKEH